MLNDLGFYSFLVVVFGCVMIFTTLWYVGKTSDEARTPKQNKN